MIVSQIAAMSKNRVIGMDNKLPWNIPEDLQYFRDKTRNRIVIMGRKTMDSLNKKCLPKRLNIVITRNADYKVDGAVIVNSVDEAFEEAKKHTAQWGEEVFVCGGEEIYRQALPKTDLIYLTEVDLIIEGDAHFPEFDKNLFVLRDSTPGQTAEPTYKFNVYSKVK